MNNENTSTSANFIYGQTPSLVKTIVNEDSIELIYKIPSMVSNGFGLGADIIYKIIYSCKDGKWHQSDRIPGEVVEATKESYEFNQ